MPRRRTLRTAAALEGVSLLSAAISRVKIAPASFGAGIVFRRAEQPGLPGARATHEHLVSAPDLRTTSLRLGEGAAVHTVEHLLSALCALGVTDAQVTVHGEGLPIFDGSALRYFEALARAGIDESSTEEVPVVELREPVRVEDQRRAGSFVEALPRNRPGCSMTYYFRAAGGDGAGGLSQSASWDGTLGGYTGVAPARTFSFASEVRSFRERNLFTHLSPRELLVIDDATGQPIENQFRFPDELARHKLLDLIGDLGLLGRPLRADVTAVRSGHELNHALVRAIGRATGT